MLTCLIVAGSLWMSNGDYVFAVDAVRKDAMSDTVQARSVGRSRYLDYEIAEQHQLRMGTEEWLADCILTGYDIANPYDFIGGEAQQWDDIDDGERTGVDD